MTTRILAAALALGLLAGCSWTTMTRPPPPPYGLEPPVACTTSRAAPILDTAAAVLLGVPGVVTTVYGIATPVCTGRGLDCLFEPTAAGWKASIIASGLVLTGLGVMEAFAAADGYGWASRCEDVKAVQLACVSGVEASCAGLRRPPGTPPHPATSSADSTPPAASTTR